MSKPKHTPEQIAERLAYDPVSGHLTWKDRAGANRQWVGERAGFDAKHGYRCIRIDRKSYVDTHIAWVLMTGEWPTKSIDHIDHDKQNCAWKNLRLATQLQQLGNMSRPSHNTSGVKGVYFHKTNGKWVANIKIDRRQTYLGSYDTKEAAAAAYRAAGQARWGEFFYDGGA